MTFLAARGSSVVTKTLSIVGHLLTILAFLAWLGLFTKEDVLQWLNWKVPVGLFVLAVFAYGAAQLLKKLRDVVLANPAYRLTSARYTLKVGASMNTCEQMTELEVLALHDGLDRYTGRYNWTGSGVVTLDSLTDDSVVVRPSTKWNFRVYDVKFPRALKKGESRPVRLKFTCSNSDGEFLPLLSKEVEELIDTLTLRVEFRGGRLPSRFAEERYEHLFDEITVDPAPQTPFDRSRDFLEWVIPDPTFRHDYVLKWWW